MEIGTILAGARKQAGLKQNAFAETLGISPSYLCHLEMNRRPFPPERVKDLPEPARRLVASALVVRMMEQLAELQKWAY